MSLYNDLPQAKVAADNSASWAPVTQLAPPPAIVRKPAASFAPPPSVLRAGRGSGRGPAVGRGPTSRHSSDTEGHAIVSAPVTVTVSASSSDFGDIRDEYDPAKPNDYEEIIKERERKKREADEEAERQARLKDIERMKEEAERIAALAVASAGALGALPGPPGGSVGLGGGLPGIGEYGGDDDEEESAADDAGAGGPKGMSLAQKLLEKMGWKHGEGLGREKQGMSTPLVAQKIDRRAGIIVNAPEVSGAKRGAEAGGSAAAADKRPKGAVISGTPTKVVCLRNMVGPGQVDPDLEDEVGNELMKYGNVVSVLIFEVTTPGFPPEESVRIFVEFDRVQSTTKALVDLQGRFFGGRMVRAAFFSEDRFAKQQLAPQAGEFD